MAPSPLPDPARIDLAAVIDRLAAAGCVAAEEEAGELVGAGADRATLERWIGRRERGEPLAWIVGSASFCGRTVLVDRGVYVPRRQSEELARRAAGLLPAGGRAADLCTGAGAIAAHLAGEVPSATVVGTDIDPRAVACARRNGVAAVVGRSRRAAAAGRLRRRDRGGAVRADRRAAAPPRRRAPVRARPRPRRRRRRARRRPPDRDVRPPPAPPRRLAPRRGGGPSGRGAVARARHRRLHRRDAVVRRRRRPPRHRGAGGGRPPGRTATRPMVE